jgi:S-formylglutathione hydrolase FrmB
VRVHRRRLALVAIGAGLLVGGSLVVGTERASASRSLPPVVDLDFRSEALRDVIGLRVYVPRRYHETSTRYPVIYFLHGLPASSLAYQNTDFLRQAMSKSDRDAIVVAVQGARGGEPDSEYLDSGPGHNWETAVAAEVPRFVDAHFRTIASRRGRAIVGLSAGGYGAVLLGLHHLQMFSVIESWSGYFHPTDVTGTTGLDLGSPTRNVHASAHSFVASLRRIFSHESTLLAFYVGSGDTRFRRENEQLDRELTVARVPHVFRVYPGAHGQKLWRSHAPGWLGLALHHLAAPM